MLSRRLEANADETGTWAQDKTLTDVYTCSLDPPPVCSLLQSHVLAPFQTSPSPQIHRPLSHIEDGLDNQDGVSSTPTCIFQQCTSDKSKHSSTTYVPRHPGVQRLPRVVNLLCLPKYVSAPHSYRCSTVSHNVLTFACLLTGQCYHHVIL